MPKQINQSGSVGTRFQEAARAVRNAGFDGPILGDDDDAITEWWWHSELNNGQSIKVGSAEFNDYVLFGHGDVHTVVRDMIDWLAIAEGDGAE